MNLSKRILNNFVVQSLLFWTASFLVVLRLFTRTDEVRAIDVIYTSLFHFPLLTTVLLHQYILHTFFDKRRYLVYMFQFLFLAFILLPQGYFFTFNVLSDWVFSDYYFISVYEWFEITGIGLIYMTVTLLLHLAKGWFKQQKTITRVALLEEEKTASELQALRAQVNPHFLFNSLNTIYGEALKKSEKAPQLILELSDILRYVVDNMNRDHVLLKDEMEYLVKYIALQKERLNNPDRVRFSISGEARNLRIAPLLLITFVENCFKHGSLSEPSDFASISIKLENHTLTLQTDNTIHIEPEDIESSTKTGLRNARRRLDLAYENRYSLEIQSRNEHYFLTLSMELDS